MSHPARGAVGHGQSVTARNTYWDQLRYWHLCFPEGLNEPYSWARYYRYGPPCHHRYVDKEPLLGDAVLIRFIYILSVSCRSFGRQHIFSSEALSPAPPNLELSASPGMATGASEVLLVPGTSIKNPTRVLVLSSC